MKRLRKKPLQVYLREDQVDSLRVIAERRGESMAALIRQGVDKLLDDLPPDEDPLLELVKLYNTEKVDLAERHDAYLSQMIREENHGKE
jgi:hypothetical protein